jgi:nitrogen fixation NifU-like protein
MSLYSQKVIEHFKNPRNQGKIEDADGVGKVGNIACGDVMYMYIRVKDNKITDIGWETLGCAAAIATTSMISELAKGKTLEEAEKITRQDVADALEGLPPIKMHCSNLASDALCEAIYDYRSKNNMPVSEHLKKTHERIQKDNERLEHRH